MIHTVRSLARPLYLLTAAALLSAPAFADTISLSLVSPAQTASAGSTVAFSGTVSVTGNSSAVNLDDLLTIGQPITGDDSDYFNNVFFNSFNSGESVTSAFFTVMLPANLIPGTYSGTFKVYEDGNSSVSNTQSFQVTIPGAAATTPEPSSWLLLATGLACTAGLGLYRRQTIHS